MNLGQANSKQKPYPGTISPAPNSSGFLWPERASEREEGKGLRALSSGQCACECICVVSDSHVCHQEQWMWTF